MLSSKIISLVLSFLLARLGQKLFETTPDFAEIQNMIAVAADHASTCFSKYRSWKEKGNVVSDEK